ncbi:MAG TPA: hypothetical protein VH590_10240, partial [Ktedonobacterales bacterium]
TLNVVARNVTASLAIAVMTNILQQRTTIYLTQLGLSALQVAQATELGAGASEPLAARQAQALAYHDVFLITALSIIPAFILALFLKPPPRKAHRL